MNLKKTLYHLTETMTRQYMNTPVELPDALTSTNLAERLLNQDACVDFLETTLAKFRSLKFRTLEAQPSEYRESLLQELLVNVTEFEAKSALFSRPCVHFFTNHGYLDTTKAFAQQVQAYDPALPQEDFFQALRNVWIMNSLQLLFDIEVNTSSSVFGYSMLYPYTDNYLDDPTHSLKDKERFNTHLRQRITEGDGVPSSVQERKIYEMLDQINHQHPIQSFPHVHESLLMIQDAQEQSMVQQKSGAVSPEDLLWLTFYKGGTSVVADAFLVKPNLTENELYFAFAYGTFLQLIDDLQDRMQDNEHGHQTWFSTRLSTPLDMEITRLLRYIDEVTILRSDVSPAGKDLLQMLKECADLMVLHAIAEKPQHFSAEYLKMIENHCRVPLHYLVSLRETLEKTSKSSQFGQWVMASTSLMDV